MYAPLRRGEILGLHFLQAYLTLTSSCNIPLLSLTASADLAPLTGYNQGTNSPLGCTGMPTGPSPTLPSSSPSPSMPPSESLAPSPSMAPSESQAPSPSMAP